MYGELYTILQYCKREGVNQI